MSAGKGRNRLEPSSIFRSEAVYLEHHKVLMELRHKYVAHNDENEFESVSANEEDTPGELILRLRCKYLSLLIVFTSYVS